MSSFTVKLRVFLRFLRFFLYLLPVVLVLLLLHFRRSQRPPATLPDLEERRSLRVLSVPEVTLRPAARGYGLVAASRVWRAAPEVKGSIVEVNPLLSSGSILTAGTVLVRLDTSDYDLAISRHQSAIAELEARLNELAVEEQSRQASLQIEQRSLSLAQSSLARLRQLLKSGVVPQDETDREERLLLQQEQSVQQLENALRAIPARRESLLASMQVQRVNLAQAKLDLERTVLRAPFACRPREVRLEKGQFVNAGQVLFEAIGTERMELEAKFRPEQMRNLLDPERRQSFLGGMDMAALQETFALQAKITLRSGAWQASWPARFDRIREAVDPRDRSINVIAMVEQPYDMIIPGERPALAQGMYCELELLAPERPNTLILPRAAVWNGHVYVVDEESRLRQRTVQLAFGQDDFWVLANGLAAGEMVVISDPSPAIEGMLVEQVPDLQAQDRIIAQAERRAPTKRK
jgi:multidrug efflux system membrane fusion protein